MNQTRARGLPEVSERRIGALAVALEAHDAASLQNEAVLFRSCFSQNSAHQAGGPGRAAGMAGSWRFCGYQEDPRPVVSGAEHRKANAQDSFFFWTVWNGTTDLQGRRTRIRGFHEMRLRAFLCWGSWEDYAREFSEAKGPR